MSIIIRVIIISSSISISSSSSSSISSSSSSSGSSSGSGSSSSSSSSNSIQRSVFKEGSVRGEITQRKRIARDKSRENTAPPPFRDIP